VIAVNGNQASIQCSTPGANIYYTLNDSIPSFTDGNLYKKPITVKAGLTILAIAKKPGLNNSSIAAYIVK